MKPVIKKPFHMRSSIIIDFENVTLRVRDTFLLPGTNWQISKGQHWAILGPNGAGKTSLVKALSGEVSVVKGKIYFSQARTEENRTGYVSFEQHQRLIAREEGINESRFFSGHIDSVTRVYEILIESCANPGSSAIGVEEVAAKLQIEHLLERGIQALSTGEMRKIQIARILINSPQILILDEPFDGLDRHSRNEMARIIDDLMDATRTVILVTHRQKEILSKISHVLALRDGEVIFQGPKEDVLTPSLLERLYPFTPNPVLTLPARANRRKTVTGAIAEILVSMKNVTVKYEDTTVLDKISWALKAGENWVILGPNGCGKTTLLNVVTADSPQAYANEIYLFGKRRGSGESIWDIKQQIGLISPEFQIRYRKPITAFEVVLSGFFDSVGLYRQSTSEQREIAEQWLEMLGSADKSDRIFSQLSYGEQRMILLVRAMVKMPRILILDEPCQGLDPINRRRILDAIDIIGRHSETNLVYVTHYPQEIPDCMTHMLRFEKTTAGQYQTSSGEISDLQ
ncbi:MAG: ATP-binding cassette domain-containing protein [Deltaproteobacteria bacterium]|nr:ATP-binding cassette domain-containing protein [Deltaproteobacteria bacterium]